MIFNVMKRRFELWRRCRRSLICMCGCCLILNVLLGFFLVQFMEQDLQCDDSSLFVTNFKLFITGVMLIDVALACGGILWCVVTSKCLRCPRCHKSLRVKFWNSRLFNDILAKRQIKCPSCHAQIDTCNE